MANFLSLDTFIYSVDTVHRDWPIFKQRLENLLRIQRVGYVIVTPNAIANPPILGEDTSMALNYLLQILEIFNASPNNAQLNYVTFTALLT